MHYVIAFIAACLMLAGGAAFCAHARQSLIDHIRVEIEKPENANESTAELKTMLDQGIVPPGFGIEVPSSMLWKLQITDLLAGLWYVWIIVAFGVCFAVAYLLNRQQGQGGT